ncbi:MAG: undecaprenyldiphospho-muramoylpentapeptide beta-N-acetylglucosaminyltransferase [Pseudomonadota bacterium]|nr:undecaprenyldiphospho-muramoylpentapeptide beta-N-acetylglucosaminyltransferase [Pseudomonadota bacterium]
MKKKIILTGGGTAGHVMPNVALIPYLRKDGWQIYYVGSRNGIEKSIIADSNVQFYGITSGKLRRYFSWRNFTDFFKVAFGVVMAFTVLVRIKPSLIFSKGGYVSVPVAVAAFLLRIKIITHESDLSFGLATKIVARLAEQVWVAFAETCEIYPHAHYTSLPIRDDLYLGERSRGFALCNFKSDRTTLLIMGGSLGSQRLNKTVDAILDELVKTFQVVHIVGSGNASTFKHSRYCVFSYLGDDFKHVLSIADLVCSRAGAGSIFEYLFLHKPMLLIPLDAGSRGDQIQNAACFEKKGYAISLPEKN